MRPAAEITPCLAAAATHFGAVVPPLQADNVYKTGDSIPWRFCFQCGKLEVLTLFDGAQR